MRQRITIIAAAILLAALVIGAGQGVAEDPTLEPPRGCERFIAFDDFRLFSADVWDGDLWKRGNRGMPSESTLRAMRRKRRCALTPRHRRAMKRRWKSDKAAFFEHRAEEKRKAAHRRWLDLVDPPGIATLEAIAACESGGDPTAVSPDGTYRGKYQFDYETWASVGGSGDPAAAPEREQDVRAARLYNERGSSPWPVCG